ncbi:MAG: SDR family oxidoreductase [Rhizobiaceae bacterium]
MKVLIFGCGFSGLEIGRRLADQGVEVAGTTRSMEKFSELESANIHPLLFDGETIDQTLVTALSETTHLVISIAPPRQETAGQTETRVDPVLAAVAEHDVSSLMPELTWIGYLSTVGVYGNHDGRWIDEAAPLSPTSARSRQRVRAEQEWTDEARALNVPLSIFRLSGIYGPGRNALRAASEGRSRRLVKPGQVFNRIHVGDIAQAVEKAAGQNAEGIFNITDDEPAAPQDVVAFAHQLLGTEPPEKMDFDKADLTPMARSFYGDNKRISNQRSKNQLCMDYQWPNYRTSLQRMFDENNW